ncbi:MAG: nitroreductase family protein [Oscillospiraceae bacterium]
METIEALLGRRSVRKYKDTAVSEGDLAAILEAACYAPSAINMQHWYFVAVRNPGKLEQLREMMGRVTRRFQPTLEARFPTRPDTVAETESFLSTLGHAQVCILAFFLKDDYPDRDGAMQSVSAALQNLQLAAWDKGLGTCWISAPQRMGFGEELREQFAPDKGEFVAAVTLGYADQTPKLPPRRDGRYVIV